MVTIAVNQVLVLMLALTFLLAVALGIGGKLSSCVRVRVTVRVLWGLWQLVCM